MIPLWIKLSYTVVAVVIVAVYAFKYPPSNFLWFSDIALLATVPALWFESSVVASTMTLAVLLPEVFWNVGFFGRLISGRRIGGLADYMFDPSKPRHLRALSLFHVFLPVLLVWMVAKLGYDDDALIAATLLAWIVFPLTYWLADPKGENVNWVRGLGSEPQTRLPPLAYLGALMIAVPVLVYLPTHLVLRPLFG
ncbi:MAG: hypothetical protein ACREV9_00400 [Burkholderiales bacterium]